MATCPECDKALGQSRQCRNCGWGAPRRPPERSRPAPRSEGMAWSPPTPPWRSEPRVITEPMTAETQAALAALKAKLASTRSARPIDPELEARYLRAVAARKASKASEQEAHHG